MAATAATARVGLLLPASNTVMEPDLRRALAGRASLHVGGMHLPDPVTREGELEMLDRWAEPAAAGLASTELDLAVLGCTSAGSLRGAGADRELRERLGELAGAPVLGILEAVDDALRALAARRISLLTPYVPALTAPIVDHLGAGGFEVLRATGLGIADNAAVGRVTLFQVLAAAREALAPGSDALAIACTNLRALEVRTEIEDSLGVPVVTVNSAVAELLLSRLNAD